MDQGKTHAHVGEVAQSTVDESLDAMLDAETDRLCRAERYERTQARKDTCKASRTTFLRHRKERSLEGVWILISDKCLGLAKCGGCCIPRRRGSGAQRIFTATRGRHCRRARS